MNPQQPRREPLTGTFRVGDWEVDPALDEIVRGAEKIKLEPRMMRLLCRLAESPGQVVSTPELLDSVWTGVVVGPASVYQAISALRKNLGDTGETPTYIATIARKGYRVISPVQRGTYAGGAAPHPVKRDGELTRRWRVPWGIAIAATIALLAAILINTFRYESEPEHASAPAANSPVIQPSTDMPSIAVVPFQSESADEPGQIFAATITDLVSGRLASQKSLIAVSWYSTAPLVKLGLDTRTIGKRLHAEYVLRGSANRAAANLHVQLSLIDTATGRELWSQYFSKPQTEVAALRDAIISRIATSLGLTIDAPSNVAVNLPAYEFYMRGIREYLKSTQENYVAARKIFQRSIELYPEFPRAYFGLFMALEQFQWSPDLIGADSGKSVRTQSIKALDRAIALDPAFGWAMTSRALLLDDPTEAEKLFRRGLDLAPSDHVGWWKYSLFLFNHDRIGEGLSAVDRGLRIDPLSPLLVNTKSEMLITYRGDVAGSEAALRELVESRPDVASSHDLLAFLRYTRLGQTAESIGMYEKLIANDPAMPAFRYRCAIAYLDVDDPDAAAAVSTGAPLVNAEVAQYRRDPHPLNALHPDDRFEEWLYWSPLTVNPVDEAFRDEAMATGKYAAALVELETIRAMSGLKPWQIFSNELAYAHTLVLSGERERGLSVAKSVLRTIETEQIGRPASWFARSRAAAFVLLGDDDRALSELAASQTQGDFVRWWYTAELDPLYAHLRTNPRFQALANVAKQHRAHQRELVDAMRRKGEIPRRP